MACREFPYGGNNWVWLSGGPKKPDVVHRLRFRTIHNLCVVHSVSLQVFIRLLCPGTALQEEEEEEEEKIYMLRPVNKTGHMQQGMRTNVFARTKTHYNTYVLQC